MNGKLLSGFVAALAAVLALLALPGGASAGLFEKAPAPQLTLPTNADKCLAPADYMRREHMNLLKEVRDDVVRKGLRKPDHHIENCGKCHTKRAEFCDRCHDYVGAKPDCFGCHYLP